MLEGIWLLKQAGFLVTLTFELLFLVLLLLRIKYQTYKAKTDRTMVDSVMEEIKKNYYFSSQISFLHNGTEQSPKGLVVGKWFFAFITEAELGNFRGSETSYNISIMGFTVFRPADERKESGEEGATKKKKEVPKISKVVRKGANRSPHMMKRKFECHHRVIPQQIEISSQILNCAKLSKRNGFQYGCIALVTGPPGTGKSKLGEILAHKTKGVLCEMYNPTEYGHSIDTVLDVSGRSKDSPLIVVLDEVDTWFQMPTDGDDKASDWLTRDIDPKNMKKTFNALFDKMSEIDNLIVICTSNKTEEELMALDEHSALFRDGRVHIRLEMNIVIAGDMMAERFRARDSGSEEDSDMGSELVLSKRSKTD